jgi:hypothetical protein
MIESLITHPAMSSAADASLPRHTAPTEQINLHTSPIGRTTTMAMGDRIKTRQQLLDAHADATTARATPTTTDTMRALVLTRPGTAPRSM